MPHKDFGINKLEDVGFEEEREFFHQKLWFGK
jgi:hypothetical protein